LPIAAIIVGFQLLVIRRLLAHLKRNADRVIYVLLGIACFPKSLEIVPFPLGRLTKPEFLDINPGQIQIEKARTALPTSRFP
jgi:hypothetical protein